MGPRRGPARWSAWRRRVSAAGTRRAATAHPAAAPVHPGRHAQQGGKTTKKHLCWSKCFFSVGKLPSEWALPEVARKTLRGNFQINLGIARSLARRAGECSIKAPLKTLKSAQRVANEHFMESKYNMPHAYAMNEWTHKNKGWKWSNNGIKNVQINGIGREMEDACGTCLSRGWEHNQGKKRYPWGLPYILFSLLQIKRGTEGLKKKKPFKPFKLSKQLHPHKILGNVCLFCGPNGVVGHGMWNGITRKWLISSHDLISWFSDIISRI